MRRLLAALVVLCTVVPAGSALAAGDVPDDRIVLSGSVLVDRGETVPGDVVVLDGDVLIRGTVKGNVVLGGGDVTIRGKVGGDVVVFGGVAKLGRAARVSGDVVYFDKKPVVAPGATIGGETKGVEGFADAVAGLAIGIWIAFSVSLVLFGLLLMLLAPKAAYAIARTAKRSWGMSIGVGLGVFILLPIVAVAICFTVIGTPLGIILLFSLVPLFALAYVSSAFALGRLILKNSRIPAFLVGMLILCLLALVPLLGELVDVLAMIFGLGLLFTTLVKARS
jgi:cytoskeletal protein CcmA (bactofilin family)